MHLHVLIGEWVIRANSCEKRSSQGLYVEWRRFLVCAGCRGTRPLVRLGFLKCQHQQAPRFAIQASTSDFR